MNKQKYLLAGKIKPAVRTTQGKKFVDPQFAEYRASTEALRLQMKAIMAFKGYEMYPPKTPLWVNFRYYRSGLYNHDIDNMLKSILDAAQSVIFPDDRYIKAVLNLQKIKSKANFAAFEIGEIGGHMTIVSVTPGTAITIDNQAIDFPTPPFPEDYPEIVQNTWRYDN